MIATKLMWMIFSRGSAQNQTTIEQSLMSGINLDSVADKASEKHNKICEKELVKNIARSDTRQDPEDTKIEASRTNNPSL
jgi:hypothetical protein